MQETILIEFVRETIQAGRLTRLYLYKVVDIEISKLYQTGYKVSARLFHFVGQVREKFYST